MANFMLRILRDRWAFYKRAFLDYTIKKKSFPENLGESARRQKAKKAAADSIGWLGEDLAVNALRDAGYRILARNRKIKNHEIDVIAEEGGVIAFIEVKSRSSHEFGRPAEAVRWDRQKRYQTAAQLYLLENKVNGRSVRFDVVSVDFTDDRNKPEIQIIKRAF
jgi:putative endonuclease